MEIVKVDENDVVIQILDTDSFEGYDEADGWLPNSLPENNDVCVGQSIHAYDSNWKIKTMAELVEEGHVKLPDDLKLSNGEIVNKNNYDYYLEGTYELNPMEYPDTAAEEIKVGTYEDLYIAGLITETEKIAKQKEADRKAAQFVRDQALNELTYTFQDGRTVQTRPNDLINFQVNIELGEPDEWVLKDNTISTLTVEDMKEAVRAGMVEGKAIWKDYKEKLKTLGE